MSLTFTPGPGAYDMKDLMGRNSPAVQIRGKIESIDKNDNPGPGTYDARDSLTKNQTIGFRMGSTSKVDDALTRS